MEKIVIKSAELEALLVERIRTEDDMDVFSQFAESILGLNIETLEYSPEYDTWSIASPDSSVPVKDYLSLSDRDINYYNIELK